VLPANMQDRDGAAVVLKAVRALFGSIERIFADGGYQGPQAAATVAALGEWQLQIIKRSDKATGFAVLPKRWIVERTFAWIGRNRRLSKDLETKTERAITYVYLAMIRLMARRAARSPI